MAKLESLLEWHTSKHLEMVTVEGGKGYYVVPEGEDMGGHLESIKAHANVEGWGVIESEGKLLVPTYAYDRILVATLPGSTPVPTLRCLRCGHAWHPRSHAPPERCPKCNSPYWDRPRKKR